MDLQPNARRFSGKDYTEIYDKYRPQPPGAILQRAVDYAGGFPRRVLDLGCGTGISTVAWQGRAEELIGVEPSEDMLFIARKKLKGTDLPIRFIAHFGHDIPLPDASADIICCAQSFHWMDPTPTLQEANRLLRPGGVFLVYDCGWPPAWHQEPEQAYLELFAQVRKITQGFDQPIAHFWTKSDHQKNVSNSGYFRFVRAAGFHKDIPASKDRLLGLALSQGGLESLLKAGYSEEETGLVRFRKKLNGISTPLPASMTLHYQAIYAVK